MNTRIEVSYKDPVAMRLVCTAYGNVHTRRTIKLDKREHVSVRDYFDGGSRTYCVFIQLSTMQAVSDGAAGVVARETANPFKLRIGDVTLTPDIVAVEHVIFCGKDLGYRIVHHPDANMRLIRGACMLHDECKAHPSVDGMFCAGLATPPAQRVGGAS